MNEETVNALFRSVRETLEGIAETQMLLRKSVKELRADLREIQELMRVNRMLWETPPNQTGTVWNDEDREIDEAPCPCRFCVEKKEEEEQLAFDFEDALKGEIPDLPTWAGEEE